SGRVVFASEQCLVDSGTQLAFCASGLSSRPPNERCGPDYRPRPCRWCGSPRECEARTSSQRAAMDISPTAYVAFFLVWAAAAALTAYVWHGYTARRRHAGLIFGFVAIFVLGAVGVVIAGQWNDTTAASSLSHQRIYLIALACAALATSALIGLKVYGSRFLEPAWRASAGLVLFVLGIAVGTTDLVGATFAEVVGRFSGLILVISVFSVCQPKAAVVPKTPLGGTAYRAGSRPRLEAVPTESDGKA